MKKAYRFYLDYLRQIPNYKEIKVLDFGCGNGEVVSLLRANQINCFGADIFSDDYDFSILGDSLVRSGVIKRIENGVRLPFPDKYFDVIISNQVLEHVNDLKSTISDLRRVLKDEGLMYHKFVCQDVLFEWHLGLPFVHWLSRDSNFRYYYTFFLRVLGVGFHKDIYQSPREWTIKELLYLDNYCFYRSYKEVIKLFEESQCSLYPRGIKYAYFWLQKNIFLRLMLKLRFLHGLYEYLLRRFFFTAFEIRRKM